MSSFSRTQNAPDEPYRRKDVLKTYDNTAQRNIVCSLVNPSFDVGFEYIGGIGEVTYQHGQVLPPVAQYNTSALSITYEDEALGIDVAPAKANQNSADYSSFLTLGNNIFGNVLTSRIPVRVKIGTTSNLYSYEQNDILVSYCVAIFVAFMCMVVGIALLFENEIYNSTSFSTVMGTTRDPDFDVLAEGACLGTKKAMLNEKVMFGILTGAREIYLRLAEFRWTLQHAAFGLKGTIMKTRKGTACS
ncbi:hypothetical protein BKA65DRAFT_584737 [Rhexocercosporidium sp. MPI-PUGE-AT-0058]|nr:hypothetical protein BKA65DRAFT_584737 [Rhexocercosporidium sp. MPI-PUGE-AT-0058]